MSKEQEVMDYLGEQVFNPILDSADASSTLKKGIRMTVVRMNQLKANKMVQFFWSAIAGTEKSMNFSARMQEEGFARFEDVQEEFRVKFNDEWLRK